MGSYQYIIVGQGIAGSLLSWFLIKQGQRVLVINENKPNTATKVASGITNPITGRRFVKSWMADELLPFAHQTYRELEVQLNESFFEYSPIVKLFDSVKAQNDWSVRCAMPEYAAYLKNETVQYFDKRKVANDFGGFEISGGTKIQPEKFLEAYARFLKKRDSLLNTTFEFEYLQVDGSGVRYKDYDAEKIIFCDGAWAVQNPYFGYLPFLPAKGECLIIKVPDFYPNQIINGEVFLMPMPQKDLYYVGATHEWNFEDDKPSIKGRQELLDSLQGVLKAPFEIVDHMAAIRPTVKDRRPFVGLHTKFNSVGIFNGLGTKGISLAPYFANHFTNHLICGVPLSKEVDIKRFLS